MDSWETGHNKSFYMQFLAVKALQFQRKEELLQTMEESFRAYLHMRLQEANAENYPGDEDFDIGSDVLVQGQKYTVMALDDYVNKNGENLYSVRPKRFHPRDTVRFPDGTEGPSVEVPPDEIVEGSRIKVDPGPFRDRGRGQVEKWTDAWCTQQENKWYAQWYQRRLDGGQGTPERQTWYEQLKVLQDLRYQIFRASTGEVQKLMELHLRQDYRTINETEVDLNPLGTKEECLLEETFLKTYTKKEILSKSTKLLRQLEEMTVEPSEEIWDDYLEQNIIKDVAKVYDIKSMRYLNGHRDAYTKYIKKVKRLVKKIRNC